MKPASLLLALQALISIQACKAEPLSCPDPSKLDGVEILAIVNGDVIDDQALPSGPADSSWKEKGVLNLVWHVDRGRPRMVYFMECMYRNPDVHVRLKIGSQRRCVARWRGKRLLDARCE